MGPRRTPGLRREEVAGLAGISVEYLIRLERGRDRNPSAAVIAALAQVLRLDDDGHAHLAALAEVHTDPDYVDDRVPDAGLLTLLNEWPHPAILMNRFMDLLAVNRAGRTLHNHLALDVGDNMTRALFLDPRARSIYPDFDDVAAENVANLRALAGRDAHHPALVQLVGELSLSSDEFTQLWARNEVQTKTTGTKRLDLPDVGRLTLTWHTFEVSGAPGQLLVVYAPVADTGTAEILESWRADRSAADRSDAD